MQKIINFLSIIYIVFHKNQFLDSLSIMNLLQFVKQLLADEEEGNLPGLDLSDSDDDATWTPFRNKEERERPVGVPNVLNQGTNANNLIALRIFRM